MAHSTGTSHSTGSSRMTDSSKSADLPTSSDLERLVEAIATDGFASHQARLAEIVDTARRSGLQPGTIEVLSDAEAPLVARERALGRLARSWDTHRHAIIEGEIDDRPLMALLDAWNTHHDLRRGEVAVADLAASRNRLEHARATAWASADRLTA